MESNVPSFFEHNMSFFMLFRCAMYSNLYVSVRREGLKCVNFSSFCKFEIKKLIFLSVFIIKILISDLTINIRSTVLKNCVFRSM